MRNSNINLVLLVMVVAGCQSAPQYRESVCKAGRHVDDVVTESTPQVLDGMVRAAQYVEPDTADDGVEISDALKAKLQALHYQMLPAVQVFVENAAIEPGMYE